MSSRLRSRVAVVGLVTLLCWSTSGFVGVATAAPCAQVADQRGWGQPVWCAEFEDYLDPNEWAVYDSPGHAGNGRRSPGQLFLGDGSLFLYGTADGTTAGLAARYTQLYGRWEARIRLYPGAGSYHPVALLWPAGGGGGVAPNGGEEIDFLEVIDDPGRQRPNFFMHTPSGREEAHANLDMTTWHTYAVENSPEGVVGYIDGQEWFRSAIAAVTPMSACLQLDWFPGEGSAGEAWMEVDYLRIYALT
ncbi:glycoside hydrolase family 16 protein [Nonomuraea sp. NPDC049152]|uniref:glycoside hydrolase family 16 protein n=1 Tax=Nonomuraea sp. NPDC049152 TaxID=3154350 RepID=UPI0033D90521